MRFYIVANVPHSEPWAAQEYPLFMEGLIAEAEAASQELEISSLVAVGEGMRVTSRIRWTRPTWERTDFFPSRAVDLEAEGMRPLIPRYHEFMRQHTSALVVIHADVPRLSEGRFRQTLDLLLARHLEVTLQHVRPDGTGGFEETEQLRYSRFRPTVHTHLARRLAAADLTHATDFFAVLPDGWDFPDDCDSDDVWPSDCRGMRKRAAEWPTPGSWAAASVFGVQ